MSPSDSAQPIVFLHSSDELYGADRMLLRVLGALTDSDRQQAEVWLPTDVPGGPHLLCKELVAAGVTVRHLDLPVLRRSYINPRGLLRLAVRMARSAGRLRQAKPRMMFFATSAMLPAALMVNRAPRQVLHLQEVWQGPESRVLNWMSRRLDQVIAISNASKESLSNRLQRRTIVVPNGTEDPGSAAAVSDRSGPLVFVIASRWSSWKGHATLIAAWQRAGQPGVLRILGGPPPVGAAVDVPELVARHNCTDTVEIIGEVPSADPYIADADVMLVPSTSPEPFGLTSIEAFARGRPVVGTQGGGLQDVVQEGAGWLVPPGDVAALADLLGSLDRQTVARAGTLARQRFESHYSIAAFTQAMHQALYQGR